MPTFSQLPSGKWRVQVRKAGLYRSATFPFKSEAKNWATAIEAQARRITVGVRPEHVRLVGAQETDAFAAHVISVEPTGMDTHIVCEVNANMLTVSVRERTRPRPGDTLYLAADPDRLHYFDAVSSAAIHA